jgi:hypothetical protein
MQAEQWLALALVQVEQPALQADDYFKKATCTNVAGGKILRVAICLACRALEVWGARRAAIRPCKDVPG